MDRLQISDCASFVICPWLQTSDRYGAIQTKVYSNKTMSLVSGEQRNNTDVKVQATKDVIKLHKRRWLMLVLFSVFSMANAYMWIHLNIIANVVLRFYNASLPSDSLQQETAVDWLSMIYMLAYLLCIPLGMFILDRYGLRVTSVVGTMMNAFGAWLKCAGISPYGFPILMAAQTLCGISQIFVVSIPPRLAAVWFGPNEVSTATAMGVFGNQVGVAVGFVIPPLIVPNSDSLVDIGHDISIMFYAGAGFCTLLFILVLFGFQGQPPHPPSQAQLMMSRERGDSGYIESIKSLLRNPSFLLMTLSYGMNAGSYYAISTLLNYMVLHHYPGEEVKVGYIGLIIILSGILGSVVAGLWLDRSKYFKSTSVVIYILSALGMVAFTLTLDHGQIWIVYLTAGLLGFFMTGYLPVGYEFAAEISYPGPEGTSSGLLTASAMLFGIIMTLVMRAIVNQVSVLAANISVSVILLLGTVVTALIKPQYNRQAAEHKAMNDFDDISALETSQLNR